MECDNCGFAGHTTPMCAIASRGAVSKAGQSRILKCFCCGGPHKVDDCDKRDKAPKCGKCKRLHYATAACVKCVNCGGSHLSRQCVQCPHCSEEAGEVVWGHPGCLKCGKCYHRTLDCDEDATCTKCGKEGHSDRRCKIVCHACGVEGHVARDCTLECDKCGGTGHARADCKYQYCTECNRYGWHTPDKCYKVIGRPQRACSNCGSFDHTEHRCLVHTLAEVAHVSVVLPAKHVADVPALGASGVQLKVLDTQAK